MSRECPNCKLEHPTSAMQCDCGFTFKVVGFADGTRRCPYCAETIQAAAVKCRFCNEFLGNGVPLKSANPDGDVAVREKKRTRSSAARIGVLAFFALVFWQAHSLGLLDPAALISTARTAGTPGAFAAVGHSTPTVTRAEYEQLAEGISYARAAEIIGAPGEEISRADIAGSSTVMYAWKNSNGSNMNAMFQNGKLITKAQLGLP